MKNIGVLLILSILVFCISCTEERVPTEQKNPEKQGGYATIIGKRLDELGLKYYYLRHRNIDQLIELDEHGFEVNVKIEGPSIVELMLDYDKKFPLFITPGDTLIFNYDELNLRNNILDYKFSGNQSAENELLAELGHLYGHKIRKETYFFNVSEPAFIQKLHSLEALANQKLKEYQIGEQQLNPTSLAYLQQFIRIKRAQYLYYYPYCLRAFFAIKDHQESPVYQDLKLNAISADDEFLNNIAYLDLASEILKQEKNKAFQESTEKAEGRMIASLDLTLSLIDSLFAQKGLRDYLKFRNIGNYFSRVDDYSPHYLEDYEKTNPPTVYIEELKKIESTLLGVFKEDLILPNYQFKDVNDNIIALDSYRGKLIYIDVWATWCGPCKIQGKYFQQLLEDFRDHEDDIVFIGVSIDKEKDVNKWKAEVKEKGLKGVQVIMDRSSDLSFKNDFRINGIPRFILINEDGKILESHALRPSQPEMKTYLEKLLAAK